MIIYFRSSLSGCLSFVVFCLAMLFLLQTNGVAAGSAPSDNRVVAIVNGSKIFFKDIRLAYENLPEQYKGVPIAQVYLPLVQQLTERRLVLLAAEKANLAEEPEVARKIKQARNRILEQSLLSRKVNAVATEKALRARYEVEKVKLNGAIGWI